MKIGPWQIADGYGVARVLIGGDVNNLADRVAFIDKTPRIRIRTDNKDTTFPYLNWAARPFSGSGPDDEKSRKWCDDALILFGYEFDI